MRGKVKNSTSGATLLIALLLFLVCAAAGSVVLAASTVSSGRLAEFRQKQQAYYAVMSASNLLKGEIVGKSIQYDMKGTEVVRTDTGGMPIIPVATMTVEKIEQVTSAGEDSFEMKLKADGTGKYEGNIPPVYIQFEMDDKFNIAVTLMLSDPSSGSTTDSTTPYTCQMTITAVQSGPVIEILDDETEIKTYTITWKDAQIKKVG